MLDPLLFPLKLVVFDVSSVKGSVVDELALDDPLGVVLSEPSDVGRLLSSTCGGGDASLLSSLLMCEGAALFCE